MSRQRRALPAVLITHALVSARGGGRGDTSGGTGTDDREAAAGGTRLSAAGRDATTGLLRAGADPRDMQGYAGGR